MHTMNSAPVDDGMEDQTSSHELSGAEAPKEIALWIQREVSGFIREHSEYMMGYHFEDCLNEILEKLAEKFGFNADSVMVEYDEDTAYGDQDSADDGRTKGSVLVNGQAVMTYRCNSAGIGMRVDAWNGDILESVISQIVKKDTVL